MSTSVSSLHSFAGAARILRPLRFCRSVIFLAAVAIFGCAITAHARVTRVVIDQKTSPAYDGKSFGGVGKYEILTGRAFGELDPKDPHNAIITDIQFDTRNARGMEE